MADTKQNQDDLIILSDDVQTDDSEMVINLDDEEKSSDDMVLTFDEEDNSNDSNKEDTLTQTTWENNQSDTDDIFSFDTPQEETVEQNDIVLNETPQVISNEVSENDDDFNFDLSDHEDESTQQEKTLNLQDPAVGVLDDSNEDVLSLDMETSDDVRLEDESLDLSQAVEAQPHENPALDTSNPTPMASVGTMESILDETILKLENRQDVIASQEEKESEHIETLEERIAALEKEKQNALDKKAELEKENKQIKENITALEKMKKADDVKKSTKK